MAISGIYLRDIKKSCFNDLCDTLLDLTHLGQESYSMSISDGKKLSHKYDNGIVSFLIEDDIKGYAGVGYNSSYPNLKPAMSHSNKLRDFTVVSDGYISCGKNLREKYGDS
ncbi:MAG: hypothetical protein QW625_03430 [Candidatus Nanoarchaeia archaeon]